MSVSPANAMELIRTLPVEQLMGFYQLNQFTLIRLKLPLTQLAEQLAVNEGI